MKKFIQRIVEVAKNVDWKSITPGTYVRYVLAILTSLNVILKAFGFQLIPVDETEIATLVDTVLYVVTGLVLVANTYKNNSTSKAAIVADLVKDGLKKGDIDINDVVDFIANFADKHLDKTATDTEKDEAAGNL